MKRQPRLEKAKQFAMVEKSNHNAIHALFMSAERGKQFLRDTVPDYCARGLYMDKTLTPDDFEIVEK